MISTLSTDTLKTSINFENPKESQLFQTSKGKSEFNKSLNHSTPSVLITKDNLNLNSFSHFNNNSSDNTKNEYSPICFNQMNKSNNVINDQEKEKMFLRNKRNIYFNVEKNSEKKPLFIINKNAENMSFSIKNIAPNDESTLSISNLNSPKNISPNKKEVEIKQLVKLIHKKEKSILFNTINYNLFAKSMNKNEGRWSKNESIKFIKAYVNFGKDYVLIQKYIGSRNSTQIISHAQKFFMKLKKLKNNDFDFSDDNIKTLWDIFQLIEAKNKNNIDKEEYIINTLISLCENIPKNEDNYLNKNNKLKYRNIRKAKEEKVDTNISSLNNEKNGKTDNYDEFSQNRNNNEDKKLIFENDEINNNLIKSNLNLNVNEKELYSEGIDINKGIEIGQNEKNQESDIFVDKKSNFSNYVNIDSYFNRNFKLDDDFIFLSGDSNLFFLSGKPFDSDKFSFASIKKSPSFNFPCE